MSNTRAQNYHHRHHQNHHYQETQGAPRSRYRKPPRGNNWQQTVPSWEKQFCYAVGSVPWRKVLETKKLMYLYENVVQWNDTAGEEAFHNAKSRFWAEINGLPCDVSLPDPDIYIDEVDWNSAVDPELLHDLECESKVPDKKAEGEEVVILGSSLLFNPSFSCTGWEEAEQEPQKTTLDQEHGNFGQPANNDDNHWGSNLLLTGGITENNGWDNNWSDSHGWGNNHDGWEKEDFEWDDSNNHDFKKVDGKTSHGWGTWDDDNGNNGGSGCYMSRYKTTRFHKDGNNHKTDRGWWKNGRGRKRVSFAY